MEVLAVADLDLTDGDNRVSQEQASSNAKYQVPLFHSDLFSDFSIFLLTSPCDRNTNGTSPSRGRKGSNLHPHEMRGFVFASSLDALLFE